MADLKIGFAIKTKGFKTVTVEKKLDEGVQGAVYLGQALISLRKGV